MSHDLIASSVLVYLISLSWLRCQKCPSTCRAASVSRVPQPHCRGAQGTVPLRDVVWEWGERSVSLCFSRWESCTREIVGVFGLFFGGCFCLLGGFLDGNISCPLCKNVFYDHFAVQTSPSLDIAPSNVTPSICGADTSRFLYLRTCLCLPSTCSCSSAKLTFLQAVKRNTNSWAFLWKKKKKQPTYIYLKIT